VTLDRFGAATRPGGAALYAAVTAHRLGLSVGLLTSHAADFPLEAIPPRIEVVSLPAASTTEFEHGDEDGQRALVLRGRAAPLTPAAVPEDWRESPIVLLAPVIDEVDPATIGVFTDAAVGADAQGWLRGVDPDGRVRPRPWAGADVLLRGLQAVFLSAEDVVEGEAAWVEWFQRVPVGVMTAGSRGALLFVNGERYEVPPRPAVEVDATGAGDVFAATFMITAARGATPWDAAAVAACAASLAVEGEAWTAVPDPEALAQALATYRRRRG
jgi:sugar/nucleoside kinase (ribokinase family)